MDCNVDTSEKLNSSHVVMPSDSNLAFQTVRTVLLGGANMHELPQIDSGRKEIMKELIREEILEKETRRLLEEEVRRELEMEYILGISRLKMEKCPCLAGTSRMVVHDDRLMSPPTCQVIGSVSIGREISQTNTTICKLSGAKRNAQRESLLPVQKQWGCALCQVSTTSEGALKEHLEGKRHRAKEGLLSSSKKINHLQANEIVTSLSDGTSTGKFSKKDQQSQLWCHFCQVKCNSLLMMENHLSGKKHEACLRLKKANYCFRLMMSKKRETPDLSVKP